ncbi:MAG: ornithine carbamoyltransferase [Candidatus Thorarchaeota archaeon SMTZ-45]|nr:MAG: ornithine carbamoyltransferase [Candidatus Thorarchaeota archaeon SMTZ1-45]KXH75747.1 MAG: ornithine carbamoyltransferase [Candidatus Thorarchaeota archaeon SMTZ-45]
MSLRGRNFIDLADFERFELRQVLDTAHDLKRKQKRGEPHELLKGKSLAMIFMKSSTRTRVSFEVGMTQLGGHALYLEPGGTQLGRGETIGDTALVLSRYCDVIMARVYGHNEVMELAKHATVPVINGLSDLLHPCQIMADMQTIEEHKGNLEGLKITYVGDSNNVSNSIMQGCTIMGMDVTIGSPKGYTPSDEMMKRATALSTRYGTTLEVVSNPSEAVKGADVIYTDTFFSMGQEREKEKEDALMPFQVNKALVSKANSEAIVMHCLPAHRDEELTSEVMDGPHSVVFDQAENRLHAQKAILALIV